MFPLLFVVIAVVVVIIEVEIVQEWFHWSICRQSSRTTFDFSPLARARESVSLERSLVACSTQQNHLTRASFDRFECISMSFRLLSPTSSSSSSSFMYFFCSLSRWWLAATPWNEWHYWNTSCIFRRSSPLITGWRCGFFIMGLVFHFHLLHLVSFAHLLFRNVAGFDWSACFRQLQWKTDASGVAWGSRDHCRSAPPRHENAVSVKGFVRGGILVWHLVFEGR